MTRANSGAAGNGRVPEKKDSVTVQKRGGSAQTRRPWPFPDPDLEPF